MGQHRQPGDGKRMVFNTAFALQLIAFCFFFAAFASPYWFQSWPRVYSPFKKIGLWEACFSGLVLPTDPTQKAYHGCWWVLTSYYQDIRNWMMPWWFIINQIVCTFTLVGLVVNLVIMLRLWCITGDVNQSGSTKRPPLGLMNFSTIITILMALLLSISVILFGIQAYRDRTWMPHPTLNYLSWSYGCAVVAAFFLIFSSIAIVIYNRITRDEYRRPPDHSSMMMGNMSMSKGDTTF